MITSTPPPGPAARLNKVLAAGRAEGRASLGLYLPVGYPNRKYSLETLRLIAGHADVVELGVPYSDSYLDGPVIQRAAKQALAAGFGMKDLFTATATLTAAFPVAPLAVSYWAPIERYGPQAFTAQFAATGGAGVRIIDLPDSAAPVWHAATRAAGLHTINMAPPHASSARLADIGAATSGMIYVPATPGRTGVRRYLTPYLSRLVRRAREATGLPVGAGIGISTAGQAAQVARYADAVVVGSALIRQMSDHKDGPRCAAEVAREFAESVRQVSRLGCGIR
ncbi:tryptophan synthase subunit alpha [Streptomyces sp. NPDC048508]|uniref:tryptophan synthase subunit alpha n=1 Tax=Streptomyces sp. NPDC048508 TaxID=3365561 RepID=UPI003716F0C3